MIAQQHIPSPSSVLLERIFRELDARLTELQTARETIASLAKPTQPEQKQFDLQALLLEDSAPQAEEVPVASQAVAEPPRRRGRPRGSRNRYPSVPRAMKAPEPRALTSSIPDRPVAVSPAELAKKRETTPPVVHASPAPQSRAGAAEGTLESLIREVRERESRRAAA